MVLVRGSLYIPAPGGSGGGSDSGPPAVIAPFPGIGAEGTYYAQQVRTIGATPQTFSLVSGALPYGMSLDEDSGIISGTAPYPYGALYEGVIGVENAVGSTTYVFQILINGTAATFTQDWTYPIATLGEGFAGMTAAQAYFNNYVGDFTATSSGVATSAGSIPITWSLVSNQTPSLPDGVTFDTNTGKTTGSPTNPDHLCKLFQYGSLTQNYFGSHVEYYTMIVVPTIYCGEWHGALPGTFTASNIQNDLFDDTTPGPRILPSAGLCFACALSCNASPNGDQFSGRFTCTRPCFCCAESFF